MASREEEVSIGHISRTGAGDEGRWKLKCSQTQVKAKAADSELLSVVPGTELGGYSLCSGSHSLWDNSQQNGGWVLLSLFPFLIKGQIFGFLSVSEDGYSGRSFVKGKWLKATCKEQEATCNSKPKPRASIWYRIEFLPKGQADMKCMLPLEPTNRHKLTWSHRWFWNSFHSVSMLTPARLGVVEKTILWKGSACLGRKVWCRS